MLIQIDMESFTDLAVYLKRASDHVVKVAQDLAIVGVASQVADSSENETWKHIVDEMLALNTSITMMEKILRAVLDDGKDHGQERLPN